MCVLIKFHGQTPQFGVIEDIILHNGPLFILEPLQTVCFNKHFHAYEVVPTPVRTFLVVTQINLADYHPLGIYQVQNSRKSFVPLKYYVLDEIDFNVFKHVQRLILILLSIKHSVLYMWVTWWRHAVE